MERVPLTLVTGFFGSGKTTLIARSLKGVEGIAVVVNDWGDLRFSHQLDGLQAETVDVTAGCLCCTRASELAGSILRVLVAAPRHVVVETSGITDPLPVLSALMGDAAIAPRIHLRSVVCVFDAVHGRAQLDGHMEARRQAALSDLFVVTKTDVALGNEVPALRRRVEEIAPGVPIVEAGPEGIAPDLLLAARPARSSDVRQHGHGSHARISAHRFDVGHRVTRDGLAMWMDVLAAYRGGSILRLKGVLDVEGRPTEVQGVLHAFHPPLALARWPDGMDGGRVAVVTDGLSRADLDPAFEALRFKGLTGGKMFTPAAYAGFRSIVERMV